MTTPLNQRPTPETVMEFAELPLVNYPMSDAERNRRESILMARYILSLEQRLAAETERADAAEKFNGKCVCVYCHKEYDRKDPKTASELADHILSCEKSPLVKLVKEAQVLCEQYETERDLANAQVAVMMEALKANGVFHTPIALRKNGGQWDEYQIDAINRTRESLQQPNLAAQEMVKDKERLDFLSSEEHYHMIYPVSDDAWHIRREKAGSTLRQAIDTAIQNQTKG